MTEYVWNLKLKYDDKSNSLKQTEDNANKICYLLKHEIQYLNSNQKLKYIRLVEYTKLYLKIAQDIVNQYPFEVPDPFVNDDSHEQELKRDREVAFNSALSKLTDSYTKRMPSYLKMERDNLLTLSEKQELLTEFSKAL